MRLSLRKRRPPAAGGMPDGQGVWRADVFSLFAEPANELDMMVSKGIPIEALLSTSEKPLTNLGPRGRLASIWRRHSPSADNDYLSRNWGVVKGGAALSPRTRT